MTLCIHDGCTKEKVALGYCNKHYRQFKKHKRTFDITCKDFNKVIDKGSYYELILLDRKMKENGIAKIDKEDLPKVKAIGRWSLDSNGYVFNRNYCTFMHRLVMNAEDDEEVDHKNTGTKFRSDNRKKKLRICSGSQNQYNKGLQTNNTSGFKGVSYHGDKKKWLAYIRKDGKLIHLGYFDTPEEASKAYKKAAKELQGKFMHKSFTEGSNDGRQSFH